MANYLLLYSGGSQPQTEAEGAAVMQAWIGWFTSLGEAVVDGGNPTSGKAQGISADGSLMDVPAEMIPAGYSIIRADSLEDAVAKAKSCPQLQAGGRVAVVETVAIM